MSASAEDNQHSPVPGGATEKVRKQHIVTNADADDDVLQVCQDADHGGEGGGGGAVPGGYFRATL